MGASDFRIMVRHVLPNVAALIVVLGTIFLPIAILAEAAISFLGIGLPSGTPSWGSDMGDESNRLDAINRGVWWVVFFPGLALSFVVLGFNLVGDSFRDISDPRLRSGDGSGGASRTGLLSSASVLAAAGGPPLAGLLIRFAGWRAIFYVNLLLIVPALVIALPALPSPAGDRPRRSFDLVRPLQPLAILVADLRFSRQEALLLVSLFLGQFLFSSTEVRYLFIGLYFLLSAGMLLQRERRRSFFDIVFSSPFPKRD